MNTDVVAPAPETTAANAHGDAHTTAGFGALTLGSIGVVYGDIGTSPLYAFREAGRSLQSRSAAIAHVPPSRERQTSPRRQQCPADIRSKRLPGSASANSSVWRWTIST